MQTSRYWLLQKYVEQYTDHSATKNDSPLLSHFLHLHHSYNIIEIHLNISSTKTYQVLRHAVLISAALSAPVQFSPAFYVCSRQRMSSILTLACDTEAAGIEHLEPISSSIWIYPAAIV